MRCQADRAILLAAMGVVPGYDNDVFISYSHIDNEPLGGAAGWVDVFHEHLQNFVNVHLGRRTHVWRDKRLTGAEVFSDEIEQQLRRSAVLISVVSPGYLQSEWCNRELVAFTRAAHERGSLRVGNLQRVVKVLRLPVDRTALPPLLDDVLGGQFYRVDAASGRARDLLLDPGPDALQMFRARVDDVAHDLSRLLDAMTSSSAATAAAPVAAAATVFLAWTTGELSEEREKLRRELEARGYRVVPADAPPLETTAVRERVLDALSGAGVAIHLIGSHYGFIPEGDVRSIVELQSDDELYQASGSAAVRIFWLAPNAPTIDPRLSALVERLQQHTPHGGKLDVLANQTIESLKTLVLDRLNPKPKATPPPVPVGSIRVYIICDQLDEASVAPLQDFLFDQSLEVRLPLFDGGSEDIRADHYETLKESDGVLVFWGQGNEGWVRTILRDLNKVFGLGRTMPYKAASLYVADPPSAAKDRFRTRELSVIRPDRESSPDALRSFVAQLCGAQG
jgi:TIR domain-containing protein